MNNSNFGGTGTGVDAIKTNIAGGTGTGCIENFNEKDGWISLK
jgi:hypothetical protein